MPRKQPDAEMDELVRELVADIEAGRPPPTEEERRRRLAEDRFIAEYPRILGELRFGDDETNQRGSAEITGVVSLAETGVRRMKEWMDRDMAHIDLALISPKRKTKDLRAMAVSGVWRADGRERRLNDVQKGLAAMNAARRHGAMQQALRGMGYVHWLTTVGRWRSVVDGKAEDTTEYSFFVPNAKRVADTGPLKDRMGPLKPAAQFRKDMLELGNRFAQQAVVVRTGGVARLYSTFDERGEVIKTLDKTLWGKEAMERFRELYASRKESGYSRPRAKGRGTGATFLLEVCPFNKVPYATYMRYSTHGALLAEWPA